MKFRVSNLSLLDPRRFNMVNSIFKYTNHCVSYMLLYMFLIFNSINIIKEKISNRRRLIKQFEENLFISRHKSLIFSFRICWFRMIRLVQFCKIDIPYLNYTLVLIKYRFRQSFPHIEKQLIDRMGQICRVDWILTIWNHYFVSFLTGSAKERGGVLSWWKSTLCGLIVDVFRLSCGRV